MIIDLHTIPTSRIALYGFGAVGRFVFDTIKRERPDLVVACIVDDGKAGGTHEGIAICSAEQAVERQQTFDRIIVTGLAWRTMSQKLDTLGLRAHEPVDLLRGPALTQEIEVRLSSGSMRLATPNRLSAIVAERFFEIEPDTIAWIETFPADSCFYDVGASNGLFALYAAIARTSTVVAFEPDALNFGLLSKNRVMNQDRINRPFIALQIALSNLSALIELVSPDLPYEGAHGKFSVADQRATLLERGATYVQSCLADSLDSLTERYGLPRPDYLKIDVDGAEFSVLEGARALLETGTLKQILIETEEALEPRLSDYMQRFGYRQLAVHRINEMVGGQVQGVSNYLYGRP
jgi:FkbM family methyltransferase